jgi:glycosyltransferase involved in cell wall biosynthesis
LDLKSEEVCVVVPTRNEARNIVALLHSIPPAIQLLVIDSSDDATPDIIRAMRPASTTVIRERCSISMARQIGAETARTAWLVCSDADVVFAPGYFDALQAHDEADVLYGVKLSTRHYARYYASMAHAQGWFSRLHIPAASGSNLAIRRQALLNVGGFDVRLSCNEDSEVAWRMQRCGYRVGFAPELVVYARDHRRLQRGVVRKTAHSLLRCTLLYLNLMPSRWLGRDWGYWSSSDRAGQHSRVRQA